MLIPGVLVFYVFMVGVELFIRADEEIYPFFSWDLFSRTPGWERTENAVIAHSIDGMPVAGTPYLIPNRGISDVKALIDAVQICQSQTVAECDEEVRVVLYPRVKRLAEGADVEFSIVQVRIDLREVRQDIGKLASGEAQRSDFYHQSKVIGRWNTSGGRTWEGSVDFVGDKGKAAP